MLQNKYEYVDLSALQETVENNFYGIIYDASFPQQTENIPTSTNIPSSLLEYTCTIKVIDPKINPLTSKQNNNETDNYINIIIKTNTKEKIPYIHAIGDIIRVHRGIFRSSKKKNVYINLNNKNFKAAWTIFPGASVINPEGKIEVENKSLYEPMLCSSDHYYYEKQDEGLIDKYRQFAYDFFTKSNSLFYSMNNTLSQRVSKRENDAVVQVIYKTELEDQIVYFVQDSTDGCELHTFKYFNFVDVNDVIRLRSYKTLSGNSNVIVMNKISNMLKIPQFTNCYQKFMGILKDKLFSSNKKAMLINQFGGQNVAAQDQFSVLDKTKYVSNPKNILIKLAENPNELEIRNFDLLNNDEHIFILEVNLIKIIPDNINDWLYVLCNNCNHSYKYIDIKDNLNTNYELLCPQCKCKSCSKLYFNLSFICIENNHTNKTLVIHLCTYDNEGENFFGLTPFDVVNNVNGFKILKDKCNKLMNKDIFVQVLVQKCINISEKPKESIFRIIGKYNTTI